MLRISIIIATRNRAEALSRTLDSIGRVRLGRGWEAEVIVVDNGSTDNTARVVRETQLPNCQIEYVFESKTGKSNALNSGLARARGEYLLFTDDDVLVPEDWVDHLAAPLLEKTYDAVTGEIVLGSELSRPWLTPMHKSWLASSLDTKPRNGAVELIGANMGFHHRVLERVPAFDAEIGPGALGLGEETLFGWQLLEAGFKVGFAGNASVTHHPEEFRLRRREWLGMAAKLGRLDGYIAYHWDHAEIEAPRLKWLWYSLKLQSRRRLQPPPPLEDEGCPNWEMSYLLSVERYKQYAAERRRPRNYSRRGLTKCAVRPRDENGNQTLVVCKKL